MNELDMSAPSSELFADADNNKYNSYTDVNLDHVVDDPINSGVNQPDAAGQEMSSKEFNFGALREEVSKMKQEREYWKGQAEALSKNITQHPEPTQDPYSELDWNDGSDVRKAFDSLKHENESLRHEMKDAISALSTKNKRSDWDTMVSTHVPELTSKNPIFAEMIQNASNPYEAAYLLAELNARSAQQQPQHFQPNVNAQRAITNAQKPQTLASIGGGGTLSSADYYANMSDADFQKIAARNLANI